jgi:multidrug efflux pump subunit AcrA (membrane-fusion protein)
MKWFKIALSTLAASGLIFLAVGCSGSKSAAAVKPQVATVQKGNISIQVTGTGNLALENKQLLSFGQTGLVSQAVTVKVSDVLVKAGQSVDAGQVLVKADPQDWQNQITTDQHDLDAKKVSLVQAQTSVVNAQTSLTTAQTSLATAQVNLVTAQNNLAVQQKIKAAQDIIDAAIYQLQLDQTMMQQATTAGAPDPTFWPTTIKQDANTIKQLKTSMTNLLADPANLGVANTDINTKVAQVNQAQASVAQAQGNITQTQASITQAQASVITAQNAVDDSQTTLNEAKNSAQVITAPIKGLITKVNVTVGSIVSRSTNLIEIAQPDLFESVIMVSERDIPSVKMGGNATVTFDAFQGLTFPAKITQIAPLATVQSGVVNYQVTVELTSMSPALPAASTASSSGSSPAFAAFAGQAIPLKDGLSSTVNIMIAESDNILLVPNRAISRQGRNTVVQVINGTTTVVTVVQTGISDSTNTEIVSGLNEGDQISLPTGTSSTTPAIRPGGFPGAGGGGLRIGG